MFSGLYSAATAMDIATRSHEVTAHNLAHSTTPGYRARGLVFQTFDRALGQAGDDTRLPLAGAKVDHGFTDFRQGAMQPTGAPLDFALSGDGFFAVQGADGPLYTRNGA
ncbi:MAG: flagellar hook-basal body complex protein, partial [Gemmataceae bacterium]|nr:flagellar hook-basal body complex protein [Gemmataceae bacterium]